MSPAVFVVFSAAHRPNEQPMIDLPSSLLCVNAARALRARFLVRSMALLCTLSIATTAQAQPATPEAEGEEAAAPTAETAPPTATGWGGAGSHNFDEQSASGEEAEPIERTLPSQVYQAPRAQGGGQHSFIEHHGYLRLRLDLFHNFDLDTFSRQDRQGSSSLLPPLTEQDLSGTRLYPEPSGSLAMGADSQSSANMRLRYQPTIHVSERLKIHGVLDIMDNAILGGSADGYPSALRARPDVPFEFFSTTQRPLESGVTGDRDALRVKALWGEISFEMLRLEFGRTRQHWGLGINYNDGSCLDCDFGDSVDRIMVTTRLINNYISFAWDFAGEGAVGFNELETTKNQGLGQPFDLDQRDDINQYTFILSNFARGDAERAAEREKLRAREWVTRWGFHNQLRDQLYSATLREGLSEGSRPSDYLLYEATAFSYTPDLYLSFERETQGGDRYQLELELVGVFGSIEEVPLPSIAVENQVLCDDLRPLDDCAPQDRIRPREREIQAWGYALRFKARHRRLRWGILHGAASGDPSAGFGVRDQSPVVTSSGGDVDDRLSGFSFDRDYIVDLILFREIIGSVSNALYFKPWIGYRSADRGSAWGFEFAAIYSQALVAEATPGGEAPLGLEFDGSLYYEQVKRLRLSLSYGFLFPLEGLNWYDESSGERREAGIAQTIQVMLGVLF
ncbi:MAG: TIGR04551 family protein [Myxococcota bacterium]|nr:TIGR04551 family protein [Myxococcota bacterium]